MPSSHHRHRQNCLLLSRLWCEQNWRQVKTVFSSSRRISRLDETVSKISVADSLDLSPILFTPPTRTRQSIVLSVSAVWTGFNAGLIKIYKVPNLSVARESGGGATTPSVIAFLIKLCFSLDLNVKNVPANQVLASSEFQTTREDSADMWSRSAVSPIRGGSQTAQRFRNMASSGAF